MNDEEKNINALERVKELLDSAKNQGHIIVRVEDIENTFPELQELEDDRIRKELYKAIWTYIPYEEAQEYITWLKKQGEIDLEHYKDGENEKRKFVGYGFLKCKGDFLSFKEGETYWLEYVGKDNYNVRSDNLLGQTFHIKPVELYTVFRPTTWLEKQSEKDPCIGCTNDKGCVTCENGNMKETRVAPKVKALDPDKVIDWLRKNLAYWCELSRRSYLVDAVKQLKEDFGL